MLVREKEIAFIELAADVLNIRRSERLVMIKMVDEYNCEPSGKLWEKIIEKLSGSKFVDESYRDFSDGTEAKTGSTRTEHSTTGYDSVKGQITNLSCKTGWIRIAIYNNYKSDIDFFLLPPDHDVPCYFTASNGNKGTAKFSYSRRNDTYSAGLEKYRVKDVYEACKRIKRSRKENLALAA